MPFWPFYMLAVAGLAVWGYRAGAWFAPVALLAGLIGTRVVMVAFDPMLHEVALLTLWLCIAAFLAYNKAWVAAFFICLSGLSYGVFFVGGLRIEYLGFLQIVADVLFWLAVLSIGGGLLARSRPRRASGARFPNRGMAVARYLAARVGRNSPPLESMSEMSYNGAERVRRGHER